MNVLYIGDIMGSFGVEVVSKVLPQIKKDYEIDVTIAQSENVTNGKGISQQDYRYLKNIGIDFFTGGNHSFSDHSIDSNVSDMNQPIIVPANYDDQSFKKGAKILKTVFGDILIVSLLGKVVGKDANAQINNPLMTINKILADYDKEKLVAIIVNFHGDYSSEKVVIGHFLDGRVNAVIGDHWHIPTADARLLPKGTAHITDVGMCGSQDSSLGIKYEIIVNRWLNNNKSRNILENSGAWQFNSVLVKIDEKKAKTVSIQSINLTDKNYSQH